jgi:hypothetical protein
METQTQKKKYVIKKVLSEEDVGRVKEELTKVLQNAMQYYRNLIGLVKEPIIRYYESHRQEAEKDMFITLDVRRFLEKYVKAYVLHHLLRYGFLPDMANITITY